ncbi:MAG TPA: DUF6496 domain-containing protein [Myxococcota bacterium]|nr:DUF6496 domain-containing protein [Myxococcota bacterium]
MPEKRTLERARKDKRAGKSPSTQAGEFVREEIHHVREGKHGARSAKQAIAIGLSKARRAGVELPVPAEGRTSERTRRQARRELQRGAKRGRTSPRRARASLRRLRKEGRAAASTTALSRQAPTAARRRGRTARKAAAKRAVRTKGPRGRSEAARKAAQTRAHRARGKRRSSSRATRRRASR